MWLAFSKRPLLIKEAVVDPRSQLAARSSQPPFDPKERLHDPCSDILEILGSLVSISSSDNATKKPKPIIRLAHYSVKEFLVAECIMHTEASIFGVNEIFGHQFIVQSSLLYIFHYAESDSKTTTLEDLDRFPLLRYACRYRNSHKKSVPKGGQETIDPVAFSLFHSNATLWSFLEVFKPDHA